MGFLEQLRQSADELAQRAAEAGRVGAARLEELAARRRVDSLLRELGALTYAEKTGRDTPEAAAEVSRLIAAIQAEERRAEAAAASAEAAARAAQPPPGSATPDDVADSSGPMGSAPPVPPDED